MSCRTVTGHTRRDGEFCRSGTVKRLALAGQRKLIFIDAARHNGLGCIPCIDIVDIFCTERLCQTHHDRVGSLTGLESRQLPGNVSGHLPGKGGEIGGGAVTIGPVTGHTGLRFELPGCRITRNSRSRCACH